MSFAVSRILSDRDLVTLRNECDIQYDGDGQYSCRRSFFGYLHCSVSLVIPDGSCRPTQRSTFKLPLVDDILLSNERRDLYIGAFLRHSSVACPEKPNYFLRGCV